MGTLHTPDDEQLKIASAVAGSVFAAGLDERRRVLVVHACSGLSRKAARGEMPKVLERNGAVAKVVVKIHKRSAIAAPHSLERWLEPFEGQRVVYDPTSVWSRAEALVGAVRAIRDRFSGQARGYFLDARSRVLLVLADNGADGSRLAAEISESLVGVAVPSSSGFDISSLAVRVVSELPDRALVAIDAASARALRRSWRGLIRGALASVVSSGMMIGAAAAHTGAANGPDAVQDLGAIGALSVFSDGGLGGESFAAAGLGYFFGEDGVRTRIEVQIAQGSGSGLRVVVTPERVVEDEPELKRPIWSRNDPAGTGPGS